MTHFQICISLPLSNDIKILIMWLIKLLKACSKLLKANSRTDDQIFDLNKQTQRIWKLNVAIKKKFPIKLLAAESMIQMMHR